MTLLFLGVINAQCRSRHIWISTGSVIRRLLFFQVCAIVVRERHIRILRSSCLERFSTWNSSYNATDLPEITRLLLDWMLLSVCLVCEFDPDQGQEKDLKCAICWPRENQAILTTMLFSQSVVFIAGHEPLSTFDCTQQGGGERRQEVNINWTGSGEVAHQEKNFKDVVLT